MKRKASKKWQVILMLTGFCLCLFQTVLAEPPAVYMDKVERMPDLGQHNGLGYLPFGGQGYCAPVAVSDGLMWFYLNGFPGMAESSGNQEITHARLAGDLGAKRYMNTDPVKGTGPSRVMSGLYLYLQDKGFKDAEIQYQGWRRHPKLFHTGVVYPGLEWIKEGVVGYGAVWLNIGWYNYNSETATYTRVGGHWLTVAGYGQDRDGNPDPEMLVVLDPALQRVVRGAMPVYVTARKIEPLPSGQEPVISIAPSVGYIDKMAGIEDETVADQEATSMKAVGFLKLTGELKTANRADFALIDGAVVLRLDRERRRGRRR